MDTQQAKNMEEMLYKWMATMMKESSANAAQSGVSASASPPSPPSESPSSVGSVTISDCTDAAHPASSPDGKQGDDARPLTRPEDVEKAPCPKPGLPINETTVEHLGNAGPGANGTDEGAVPPVVMSPGICAPIGREHEHYYFKDGNTTFLLDGVLFRVHRFFFERDSALFRDVILKDIDSNPGNDFIRLNDCTAVDFERFLGVLYPTAFHQHTATTLDEWTSILALSTQWGFDSIRLLAIKEVMPLASPIDKIVLGHKYDIQGWLPDAYHALCVREDPLSDDEAERLGAKDTARVARIRERRMALAPGFQVTLPLISGMFGLSVKSEEAASGPTEAPSSGRTQITAVPRAGTQDRGEAQSVVKDNDLIPPVLWASEFEAPKDDIADPGYDEKRKDDAVKTNDATYDGDPSKPALKGWLKAQRTGVQNEAQKSRRR